MLWRVGASVDGRLNRTHSSETSPHSTRPHGVNPKTVFTFLSKMKAACYSETSLPSDRRELPDAWARTKRCVSTAGGKIWRAQHCWLNCAKITAGLLPVGVLVLQTAVYGSVFTHLEFSLFHTKRETNLWQCYSITSTVQQLAVK